jgi:diguanylate cyclase (GGDEF)-like protein/PAS domain S-box-containing protein
MPQTPRPEQLLVALLESAEEAILSFTRDGIIQNWSRGAERLYGYTAEEVVGHSLARLMPVYEAPMVEELFGMAHLPEFPCCATSERLHKNGGKLCVGLKRTVLRDDTGAITGILESGEPVGRIAGDTQEDKQLRLLIEQLPVMLWTTDQNLRITSNWGAGLKQPGMRREEAVGKTLFEFLHCADRHATPIVQHYEALRGKAGHLEYVRKNRVLDIYVEPLRAVSGEIVGCIGMAQDITDRKKSEEQVLYQASHDALTGLANYRKFIETLEHELQRAERSHKSFAILLLDMNELKRINDRLGHLAGNRALKRLADLMKEQCRATDLAARYGGDEFAVVLIDADRGMAEQVAGRIESGLRNDKEEPQLSVSIGIGVYPEDGRIPQELLEAADQRLYGRKKAAHVQNVSTR